MTSPVRPHPLHPKRFLVWGIGLFALSAVVLLVPVLARGVTPAFTEWAIPTYHSAPEGLVAGPDGNMWFAETQGNKIAKINPSAGTITEYNIPLNTSTNPPSTSLPRDVVVGPDGNLWFVQGFIPAIGKMTTSGTFTQYLLNRAQFDFPINPVVVGSDIWFSSFQGPYDIGEMDTNGNILHEYVPDPGNPGKGVEALSLGSDGNLWFSEQVNDKIDKLVPSTGALTQYAAAESVYWTTNGPDGNIWFTGNSDKVGKINVSTGAITMYTVPSGAIPQDIISGPSGKLYFGEGGATRGIGILDPSTGSISEYASPSDGGISIPMTLAVGPDNAIWYAIYNNVNSIGRMDIGLSATPTPTPTPATPTPTPVTHTPTPSATPVTHTPTPSPSAKPSASPVATTPAKVGICHITGSKTHPYEYIVVDQSAVPAFAKEVGNIFGVASAADCPTTLPSPTPTASSGGGSSSVLLNSDPDYVTAKGSTQDLAAGDVVNFILSSVNTVSASTNALPTPTPAGSDHHTVTIESIGKSSCDVIVHSSPIAVHLVLGRATQVAVDGSGQPNISIELTSIEGSKAVIIFKALSISVAAAPILTGPTAGSEGLATQIIWPTLAIVGMILGVILILIELALVYRRKHAKPVMNTSDNPAGHPTPPPLPPSE
jgi:streptogramin lyase